MISAGNPSFKKIGKLVLAGMSQWIKCQPVKQRVAGSIPSQGTCLGYRPGPQLGARERQPCFSPSLSPSLSLTLETNK